MAIDPNTKHAVEIRQALAKVERILASGVLDGSGAGDLHGEAMFTLLIIHLGDVLQFLESLGSRITFSDDMPETGDVSDITDLVAKVRGVACHVRSDGRAIPMGTVGYGVWLLGPSEMTLGGAHYRHDYSDDIAIVFGRYRIYLNRHIRRATAEAKMILGKDWM